MLAAKTTLDKAQKVKEYLLRHSLFHPQYLLVKEMGFIYFPLRRRAKIPSATIVNTKFQFPSKQQVAPLDELLKGKLTPQELQLLPRSQETVGKILILEIPEELRSKEKIIAQAFLTYNKSISTVVKKDQIHAGEYRLRKVQVLAGKNTKETIHHENGIKLKIHLEKTYFSSRSAHERLRIAKLVKAGEVILVMFSGAAPYPLVLARNSFAKIIYSIEINPLAHQLALENVALNNLSHKIIILEGDVRKILPPIRKKFNRIIMPLPKTGEQFLPVALAKVKLPALIHLYSFLAEEEIALEKRRVQRICIQEGYKIKVLQAVKCGQFSPHIFRVCFDIKVEQKLSKKINKKKKQRKNKK